MGLLTACPSDVLRLYVDVSNTDFTLEDGDSPCTGGLDVSVTVGSTLLFDEAVPFGESSESESVSDSNLVRDGTPVRVVARCLGESELGVITVNAELQPSVADEPIIIYPPGSDLDCLEGEGSGLKACVVGALRQ